MFGDKLILSVLIAHRLKLKAIGRKSKKTSVTTESDNKCKYGCVSARSTAKWTERYAIDRLRAFIFIIQRLSYKGSN